MAFPDIYVTCVGQSRLFQNTGKGRFIDVTERSGLGGRQGFSSSALWFDYDRDGLLDLFVCNYVKWSPEQDVFCSMDGKHKSYCTPEAYRGATCWLFRNRGDGTFEDVTAKSGIFDSSSKSLGVAMLDYDQDGWIDLFVANDTQPNKLYRNQRNGTFQDIAVKAGVAFSEDGKARAGMGVDVGRLRQFRHCGPGDHQLRQRDDGLLSRHARRPVRRSGGRAPMSGGCRAAAWASAASSSMPTWTACSICWWSTATSIPAIRDTRPDTGYAQPPHLFLNKGRGGFQDVAPAVGRRLRGSQSRTRRGLRRLRPRWRSGCPDHHQPGARVSLSQRSVDRPPRHPVPAGRNQIEPRRHRGNRARHQRRRDRIAHGQERIELSIAIRNAGHFRARPAGYRRARRHALAQRESGGTQKAASRPDLRMR